MICCIRVKQKFNTFSLSSVKVNYSLFMEGCQDKPGQVCCEM